MTPASRSLPRAVRLARPADFTRVYEWRRSAAAGPIVVYAAPQPSPAGAARLGLSVSRRIGGAVVRNRWKRQLREAFRAVRGDLPAGHDVVIVVRSGPPPVGADGARRLRESLVDLVRRILARPGYAGGGVAAPPPPRRR